LGAPKRNRKKYEKPKDMWSIERIKSDGSLIEQYGLRDMRELWKAQTEIGRIRRNARLLLSGESGSENVRERMLARLQRIGLARQESTVDSLLDLKESSLLERRLQTVVFRKGLARSIKQARQLTVHGFIAVNGRKVNRPGYIVNVTEEAGIGYYRPIDIMPKPQQAEQPAQQTEPSAPVPAEQPAQQAAPQKEGE
jgi:small subunit ribosomal protein S4